MPAGSVSSRVMMMMMMMMIVPVLLTAIVLCLSSGQSGKSRQGEEV